MNFCLKFISIINIWVIKVTNCNKKGCCGKMNGVDYYPEYHMRYMEPLLAQLTLPAQINIGIASVTMQLTFIAGLF